MSKIRVVKFSQTPFFSSLFAKVWISQSNYCNFDHHKMPRIPRFATLLKEYEAAAKSPSIKAYVLLGLAKEDSFEHEIYDLIAAE